MNFEPIASSSDGNCYRVTDGNSTILLECGIRFKDIQQALNFKLSDIEGCLITHEHKDHSFAVNEMLKRGIDCYMSRGTAEALNLNHYRVKIIEARTQFTLGSYTILPFETEHDVAEPLGFLISNKQNEKLLFATDTYFIRYRFSGLTIIAVECNYSEDLLRENILSGDVPVIMKRRLERSHFSLENYKEFLKANDLTSVREIWMLHMSSGNGDPDRFKKEIQGMTGKQVYIP